MLPFQFETSRPLARAAVAAADELAGRSAATARTRTASSPRRPRRAPMGNPRTCMRLAQFCSPEVKKALLGGDCRAGLELLAEPRAPHESTHSRRGDELAVLDEDGAAQKDMLRRADDLGALVQ